MRILVTGACGFVGRYLVPLLAEAGHEVFAAVRSSHCFEGIKATEVELELLDYQQLKTVVQELQPEGVIHLAAQSQVAVAWEEPADTFAVNTIGTINLLNALAQQPIKARILSVGSGEEYGLTAKGGEPLSEEHPCLPQNPYAISKLAAGMMLIQLGKKHQMAVMHVRAFNHFGPGQAEGYVVSDFASQLARIEKYNLEPIIKVGDLSASRDFTDVRDVVEAYLLLLNKATESGIYNVCSGEPRQIQTILEQLLSFARVKIEVFVDKNRLRVSEVPFFVGSAEKIKAATGWKPSRVFTESLEATLKWWRKHV